MNQDKTTVDGVEYIAQPTHSGDCTGCAFTREAGTPQGCPPNPCTPGHRSDARSVIWVKAEQPTIPDVPSAKLSIYVIGSLRNPAIPEVAAKLRAQGYDVFDDWYSAGPEADDYWRDYEKAKGHTYQQALEGYAAQHVFHFDKSHLDRCDAAVLVLPAGKSGHLELGYFIGTGKPGYILLDKEPDRFDVMYRFATAVVPDVDSLIKELAK